jgi:hypothetical protein
MLHEPSQHVLELEVAPRKLGIALGVALFSFGLLGVVASLRVRGTGDFRWTPVVMGVLMALLGWLTVSGARGVRAQLDREKRVLRSRRLGLLGESKPTELGFADIKELALLGSSRTVGIYAQFGTADDVSVGQFMRTEAEREELRTWLAALRQAIPSAKFTASDGLEAAWL